MTIKRNPVKINQILCLFLAVYLLNISVDAPDVLSNQAENLAFNDQESLIEIVVEKILNYENSIKELDDNDTEQHSSFKKNFQGDYYILLSDIQTSLSPKKYLPKPIVFWKYQKLKSQFSENTYPPPEV
jgi:hypothetical protein